MIALTEENERELEERLRRPMLAEDRDHLRAVLDAVHKARAAGGRIIHIVTGETRMTVRLV